MIIITICLTQLIWIKCMLFATEEPPLADVAAACISSRNNEADINNTNNIFCWIAAGYTVVIVKLFPVDSNAEPAYGLKQPAPDEENIDQSIKLFIQK